MMTLPPPAEAWLSALAAELWTLASDERDAVIAELRGHLGARAAAGALDATLAALGSPNALAAAYDPVGEGGIAPLPEGLAQTDTHKSVRDLLRDVGGTLRASRNGLMLVGWLLVTMMTATDFLLWTGMRVPSFGGAAAVAMVARVAALPLACSAAYRLALSPRERAWAVDRGFLAFAGALLLATALAVATAVGVGRAVGALVHGPAADGLRRAAGLLMLLLAALVLLRVQPWMAALAARREGLRLRDAWAGTRGRMATVAGAWAVLVLPLYLLHSALSLLALRVVPVGPGTLLLAGADGVASAGIAIGATMLNAAVYRWIVREPVPAPSPFATGTPDPALVAAARARLGLLRQPPQPVRAA